MDIPPDEPMPATKERLGDYDAIETAKPGEILFPIQAGDPLGPMTVQFWADQHRLLARAEPDLEKQDAMLRKATAAEAVGWQMQAYQRGETPADSQGARAKYNDAPIPTDNSDEARATRRALIESVSALHQVEAGAVDVADTLARLGVYPNVADELREAAALIHAAADDIEPRRNNERS